MCLVIVFTNLSAYAIEWSEVVTPKNKKVYLDLDSINELNDYYFYNIKVQSGLNEYKILTIQSCKNSLISAKIATYSLAEYENLKGNYANIFKNKTNKLEPVTYDSIVSACQKKVKFIKQINNTTGIIIDVK